MGGTLLYITSPSYSGSTLLTLLLAEHPQIATVGELKASAFGDIESYACSCGTRLLDCSFWRSVERDIKESNRPFSLGTWRTHFASGKGLAHKITSTRLRGPGFEWLRRICLASLPGLRAQMQEVLDENQAVIDVVLNRTNAAVFLDGSKDPIRAKHLMDSGRWEVKIILLIRDGRGFSNSYMKHEQTNITEAVREWKLKVEEILALEQYAKPQVHRIRYEDLCETPLETVNGIFEFAGLSPLERLNFPLLHQDRHIFGNDMRLRDIENVKADEKWRHNLTEEDQRYFQQKAQVLNRQFGYA